ncbi:MAG: arsenosugar biosynthesis radical SAM protein ArsS [Planctomycetes bacterium]|nr:arsenosugar biosynthesis radical SAM protein ArsS [Planctomycetota bacterium]
MSSSLDEASRGLKLAPTLQRRGAELASPRAQLSTLGRAELADSLGGDFDRHLGRAGLAPLVATGIQVLQLNVGRVCNQTCAHCHVDAGPDRRETMSRETAELAMRVLASTSIPTVDITGGAPELNEHFEYLVRESRRLGRHVLDRCNLTILGAPRYRHLPRFFAEHQVEVVCSLPHYRKLSTDRQRGEGVFEASIEGLKLLNAVGYGKPGSGLRLVLVTNPVGAFLPSGQRSLEAEWKRELKRLHDVDFDALYTITNMPISRFLEWLCDKGELATYLEKLVAAFNPAAAAGVMCRTTLSVGWDGRLFDCDFNQMLELELGFDAPKHLRDFELALLEHRRIVTGRHCFGCTAGAGSSCGGSLA